ncbi:Upstream stimulatory factor 2 [Trichuris trichiura]|uniref:Upstream stimulatory factor 2 n=1 Tax=Trichuris trichiura TaxID=36087 RepID=A0A077ZL89_TRITR|nr:Upstream stimulatory factor 2 [Trichuris trichiura]
MESSVLMRASLPHCPSSGSAEACSPGETVGADGSAIGMVTNEAPIAHGNPPAAQGPHVECPGQTLPFNSCFLVLSVNDTAQANLNNALSPDSIVLVTNKCNSCQSVGSVANSLSIDEPKSSSSESASTYCSVSGVPLGGKVKEDRRRLNHNQVEKRRREKINELISKLGTLVLGNAFHTNREFSKSTILARVMDYLVELQHAACKLPQTARSIEAWSVRLSAMKQQITTMEERNRKLRTLLMEIAGQSPNLKEEPIDK